MRLRELLKITSRLPIIQAPMAGGSTTSGLVAAVSNKGGLGSIGAGYLSASDLRDLVIKTKALTSNDFAVNLFISPKKLEYSASKISAMTTILNGTHNLMGLSKQTYKGPEKDLFEEQLQVIIEQGVKIFSFTFGYPKPHQMELLKKNNIIVIGTATCAEEAVILERIGCDAIVAQGSEAGGHRGSFLNVQSPPLIGLMALLPSIIDSVKIPVIAAGGIMDGRGIIAALTFGAEAVQMGTAFLTCKESGAHVSYVDRVLNSRDSATVLTKAFSGRWARGIENQFIKDIKAKVKDDDIPDYPIQNTLTGPMRKEAAKTSNPDFMSLWAGQGAGKISKRKTVAELFDDLELEASEASRTEMLDPMLPLKGGIIP